MVVALTTYMGVSVLTWNYHTISLVSFQGSPC